MALGQTTAKPARAREAGPRQPMRDGLALVPGSLTLIGLRLSLILLAALPTALVAWRGLAQAARQPYFTDVAGPLPLYHLGRLWTELPPSLVPGMLLGAVFAVLFQQLLLGGALFWLVPGRPRGQGVFGSVLKNGWAQLGKLLRVLLLVAALNAGGLALLRAAMQKLAVSGELAGWTALALELRIPIIFGALAFCWVGAVGALGFACKLVLVADERRLVRSAVPVALRLLKRKLFSFFGFFFLLTSLSQGLGVLLLVCWRQLPPASLAGALGWLGLGLFCAILQAAAWHWLLRGSLLVYADPRLADLREAADAPWGWGQILAHHLWQRWR